jgi:uncharacterized delta-60 repeat protein
MNFKKPIYTNPGKLFLMQRITIIKYLYFTAFFLVSSGLYSQVPDSTFGVPSSFDDISTSYFAGTTGCGFDPLRDDRAYSVMHLSDGRILLGGHTAGADGTDFALVRLLEDGTYDNTAGYKGQMRIDLDLPHDSCLTARLYYNEQYVLMGGTSRLDGTPFPSKMNGIVARVDLDGEVDTSFGADGYILFDLPSATQVLVTALAPQSDGKIIFAGTAIYHSLSYDLHIDSTVAFVGRLTTNGQIDTSFGENGFVLQRFEENCNATVLGDMLIDQEDGILITGGNYHPYPGVTGSDFCSHFVHVYRFYPDGQADITYGEGGYIVIPGAIGAAETLYLQEDGKMLLLGSVAPFGSLYPGYTIICRILPNGGMDSTFADDGIFYEGIFGGADFSEPVGIVKVNDHYYIGFDGTASGDNINFGVFKIDYSGKIDSTFGTYGIFHTLEWLPFYGEINSVSTVNGSGIFFVGTHYRLLDENMMISKIKVDDLIISDTPSPPRKVASMKVYPNPAFLETIHLEYQGPESDNPVLIRWTNLQGQRISNQYMIVQKGMQTINISDLPSGFYVMEIIGDQFRMAEKIIISH